MRYIASCSFGKDSIAAITEMLERGEPVDEALYCRIMFDDKTSAEFSEHEEWIHNVAISKLERDWGVKTKIVQAEKSYLDYFYTVVKRGENIGTIYGFPQVLGGWCNSHLKTNPMKKYYKTVGCDYREIIGIAADEPKRAARKGVKDAILPLVDYGITENQAFDICRKHGLLSPAYNKTITRLGCWFCHKCGLKDWRYVRSQYPELWGKLLKIDSDSRYVFNSRQTVTQLDERFRNEELQQTIKIEGGA